MGLKKYEVTGPRAYLGHAPGSVFEADLPEAQEARALEAGVLKVKPANANVVALEPEPTSAAAAEERPEREREAQAAAEQELADRSK